MGSLSGGPAPPPDCMGVPACFLVRGPSVFTTSTLLLLCFCICGFLSLVSPARDFHGLLSRCPLAAPHLHVVTCCCSCGWKGLWQKSLPRGKDPWRGTWETLPAASVPLCIGSSDPGTQPCNMPPGVSCSVGGGQGDPQGPQALVLCPTISKMQRGRERKIPIVRLLLALSMMTKA